MTNIHEPLEMSLLFDFYGDVLTEKQRDFFDLYHNEDMSLAEISQNTSITRQGVRDVLVRATQTLRDMERKLNLIKRHREALENVNHIKAAAKKIQHINQARYVSPELNNLCETILKHAGELNGI